MNSNSHLILSRSNPLLVPMPEQIIQFNSSISVQSLHQDHIKLSKNVFNEVDNVE